MIEYHHVGIHIIQIVAVRGVMRAGPFLWYWGVLVKHEVLGLRFIVHTVETSHLYVEVKVNVKVREKVTD